MGVNGKEGERSCEGRFFHFRFERITVVKPGQDNEDGIKRKLGHVLSTSGRGTSHR